MSKKSNILKKFLCLTICLFSFSLLFIPSFAASPDNLIVGGNLFGLKVYTDGVPIVSADDIFTGSKHFSPCKDAGLLPKDIIVKIDGKKIYSSNQVREIIKNSKGKPLMICVIRNNSLLRFNILPVLCDDGFYRIGLRLRDNACGIGTVTYINPETLEFAGLGHGICDSETLELIPFSRGSVSDVSLNAIIKGKSGHPGEIKGSFQGGKIGTVLKNSRTGVYGVFSSVPSCLTEKLPVAHASDIKDGFAVCRCMVDGKIKDYKILISKINMKSSEGKNFVIDIEDKELLNITGGIIQGMSGSPIIQNGKIIGAVTHVLVNEPTRGYGIFIGNMLSNAA